MNKYKKLVANTFIVGLGTFSSKVLVFLLMPLYTRVLTTNDYGVVDLVVQTSNLLIPIISLGIADAVIRFGLDRNFNKQEVFTTGIFTSVCGFVIFLLFAPLLHALDFLSGYTMMVYFFVLMSSLRLLCSRFVRARQLIRLYTLDGFLCTVTTILFSVLFLVVFKWGIFGYLLAIILSDFCSVLFLVSVASLHRYLRFQALQKKTLKTMLKYAIPLIPSNIFWWITNVSDRYIITALLGAAANGLYAVSYKIPTVINLVSGIFYEAWQISAVMEGDKKGRDTFFSQVFNVYQALIFAAAGGIILLCKVITKLLVSQSFYDSWRYIPFLVLATTFSCFAAFLNSIYMVEKKTVSTFITSAIGSLVNIGLNFLLIPSIGIQGAAIATFISCFLIFLLRAVNTNRLIRLSYPIPKFALNTLLLLTQSVLMIREVPHWPLWVGAITLVILLINTKMLLATFFKLLGARKKSSKTAQDTAQ